MKKYLENAGKEISSSGNGCSGKSRLNHLLMACPLRGCHSQCRSCQCSSHCTVSLRYTYGYKLSKEHRIDNTMMVTTICFVKDKCWLDSPNHELLHEPPSYHKLYRSIIQLLALPHHITSINITTVAKSLFDFKLQQLVKDINSPHWRDSFPVFFT